MLLRRILLIAPPVVFGALLSIFAWGLLADRDVGQVRSALINKPIPEFVLPPVEGTGKPGFSSNDLRGEGVKLVNIFASWCIPCRAEHVVITRLAEREGLAVYGFNWKDKPEEAAAWLSDLGNPYRAVGGDLEGRVAIDWGISGIPETFIIDGDGTIRYQHIGPLVEADIAKKILPIVREIGG
ncbi:MULTISPECIES: DsbE family thiol:disulfide interchange protein [Limibacillus]|jgi:cytochrome c biogenesis protein CcmG/thiol:disulfide interchange protein DsbE|uniref:Cytochrome c biogenesis protein CcmG/thiol:disulfide interchange protein DsbE n=1 Tax=Limibacillus halophilus TaxID=1579333 RepID=A0A839SXN0_9PROT|nr:DsbE family thiol:disulfide interchange protein [Limibacillus halophilus]MBB3066384.1 cytochrome c biogenesis protein CcmG/thiol:disulfide interchange protein DsbE [Limibacillus halophilus]